jgi:hypothetical protein
MDLVYVIEIIKDNKDNDDVYDYDYDYDMMHYMIIISQHMCLIYI